MQKEVWTTKKYDSFQESLQEHRDSAYHTFTKKLTPTKLPMLGIRTPKLRSIAKEISKETEATSFLEVVQPNTYEEVTLEGFVLGTIKEKEVFEHYFDKWITKVDNWATCDMCCSSFQVIKKYPEYFFPKIKELLKSNQEFDVRVGVILMMDYYLNSYLEEVLSLLSSITQKDYYVKMAIAWLLSVVLVKDYNRGFLYLKNSSLDAFTHNKAISKARESYRLTKEQKEALLVLKK